MGRRKKTENKTLKLGGDLTIQRSVELKECILDYVDKNQTVIIDHEEVEDVDLTYLQLLVSAKRYSEEKKKEFQINYSNDAFNEIIQLSGFEDIL